MDIKKINWAGMVNKYTDPQAVKDLDRFLDALPVNVGYNALIAAGVAWLIAGSAIFFTSQETEKVSKLHADLMQVQALQPPVPVLQYVPIGQVPIAALAERISKTYKGITLTPENGGVTVTGADTDYFPQFLAAISTLQRGGRNWKVKVDKLCVGRACTGPHLSASLKIEQVRFGDPETKKKDDIFDTKDVK